MEEMECVREEDIWFELGIEIEIDSRGKKVLRQI